MKFEIKKVYALEGYGEWKRLVWCLRECQLKCVSSLTGTPKRLIYTDNLTLSCLLFNRRISDECWKPKKGIPTRFT